MSHTSPPLEGCLKGGVVNSTTPINYFLPPPIEEKPHCETILTTINNQPIYRNFIDVLPYNPKLKPLLKDKRKEGILSEVIFWQQVHKRKFHNIDFDRQRIVGNYIVDFYVKTLGLVIEIDGSSHDNKQDYDKARQLYLENLGLKVYRITDTDIKKNIGLSMIGLEKYILKQYSVGVKEPPRPTGTPPKEGNFTQDIIKNNL